MNQTAATYEVVSLFIALISLATSIAAAFISKSSLSQAKQVADRDQREWRQRKWFDLYFGTNEFYDSFEHFQERYKTTSSPFWGTKEWEQDWNNLMFLIRKTHSMAAVFPKNSAIDALFSSTDEFDNPEKAMWNDRLNKVFDALEGIRQKALVDPTVLA